VSSPSLKSGGVKSKSKSTGRKSKSKSESTGLKSKSQKNGTRVGLESKSWTRVLHLCKCSLKITNSPAAPITKHLTRAIRAINITELCHDILSTCLINHHPSALSDLVECYNSTLSQLFNKHAPIKSRITRTKPRNPWYILALKKLELAKRHLERIWSRTHSFEDLKNLRSATNHYHAAIIKAKLNL